MSTRSSALNVRCPKCGRPVGQDCRRSRFSAYGQHPTKPHRERIEVANAKRDEEGSAL